MIREDVFGVGWKEPSGSKGAPLQILFVGNDVERAREVLDDALNVGQISFARVCRGLWPGPCQVVWSGTIDDRPKPFGPTLPAGVP